MIKAWSEESPGISYNNWLREEALNSRDTLRKNTARLRRALQVLDSVISQEETTSARFARVSAAEIHLMTEIHLLVTMMEDQ